MNKFDVVIVGAGPSGSTCAKACAEKGLKTLIVEKQRLPRDKVCSGMVMGSLAKDLIKREFGEPPRDILTSPSHLKGYCFHIPGIGMEKIHNPTWLSWRSRLDHWMSQGARECGAVIWDGTELISLEQGPEGLAMLVTREGEKHALSTACAVGADGAGSQVRKIFFPELQVRYGQALQEHLEGEADLDREYFHWFYPREIIPSFFTVHRKDGAVIIEAAGKPGATKEIMVRARSFLNEHCGLPETRKPVWRGSCLEPALYRELTSRVFRPARGNVLLVGDAAGFIMPVSGEGIGLALHSALAAAEAVIHSTDTGAPPEGMYLKGIESILVCFEKIYPWFRRIMESARGDGTALPGTLRQAYESTLLTVEPIRQQCEMPLNPRHISTQ